MTQYSKRTSRLVRTWGPVAICTSVLVTAVSTADALQETAAPAQQEEAAPPQDDAQQRPGTASFLQRNDKNGDGEVTADEMPVEQLATFEQLLRIMDSDNSGSISREEWAAFERKIQPAQSSDPATPAPTARVRPLAQAEQIIKQLDKNGDGKVELNELPEDRRERFAKMIEAADLNGDGAVDLEELQAERRTAPSQPAVLQPAVPGPNTRVVPIADVPGTLLEALDTDKDGLLSAEEIVASPKTLLRLDRDGDGRISPQEMGQPAPQAQPDIADSPAVDAPAVAATMESTVKIALDHLMQKDHDGDGKLRRVDLPPVLASRFETIDKDGDGLADSIELLEPLRSLSTRRVNIRAQQPGGQSSYEATIPLRKSRPQPDAAPQAEQAPQQ